MKFSPLPAPKVVKIVTFGTASDEYRENYVISVSMLIVYLVSPDFPMVAQHCPTTLHRNHLSGLWNSKRPCTHKKNYHRKSRFYVSTWRHQRETFCALLAIYARNSPVTGEFPAHRPVTRSFAVSLICAWINGWVNNGEAGDLRRHCANYDVTVMKYGQN